MGLGLGLCVGGGGFPPWELGAGASYNEGTGIWTITPTLGDELATDGGFEAWTGDVPDNWTKSEAGGSTITDEAVEVYAGSHAADMYIDAAKALVYLYQTLTVANGSWLIYSVYAKSSSGTASFRFSDESGNSIGHTQAVSTTWAAKYYPQLLTAANPQRGLKRDTFAGDVHIYFDSLSAKKIDFDSAIAKRNYFSQKNIAADMIIPAGYMGAVITRYSDSSNYLIACHDRYNAYLYKVIAGAPTKLIESSSTHGDWRTLEIRFADINTAQLYYNNLQIGTNQDISDVPTGKYGGVFATGSSVQIKNVVISS